VFAEKPVCLEQTVTEEEPQSAEMPAEPLDSPPPPSGIVLKLVKKKVQKKGGDKEGQTKLKFEKAATAAVC